MLSEGGTAFSLKIFGWEVETRFSPTCRNSSNNFSPGRKPVKRISISRSIEGEASWRYKGPASNPYQTEWDALVEAIRKGTPYNEVDYAALSTMTAILGRMASYSGQLLRWEEALNARTRLAPEKYALDARPPVAADNTGRYPVALPGLTQVL